MTPQLSKVVERAVGILLLPWLDKQQAFGAHQNAFGKGRGYKGVLAINVCSWQWNKAILLASIAWMCRALLTAYRSCAWWRNSNYSVRTRICCHFQRAGLKTKLLRWWSEGSAQLGNCSATTCFKALSRERHYRIAVIKTPGEVAQIMDFLETMFADDFNCFKRLKRCKVSQAIRAEI